MVQRYYRGVTKPKYRGCCRGWLAQNKSAKLWKLGFKTQAAARDWLASQLGVPTSSLAMQLQRNKFGSQGVRAPESSMASQFRGVVGRPHRIHGHAWQARLKGKSLGSFCTEVGAARCLARALGTTTKKLKKDSIVTRKRARELFIVAHAVFKAYVPGDLAVTKEQEGHSALQKEPLTD
jgi:hypothetical protein